MHWLHSILVTRIVRNCSLHNYRIVHNNETLGNALDYYIEVSFSCKGPLHVWSKYHNIVI